MTFLMTTFFNLLLHTLFVLSLQAREIPPLTGPVLDEAGVFQESQKKLLEDKLQTYWQQTGIQLQVVFLRSLEGDVIEDFSIKAVEQWKLGNAKDDRGLLILFSIEDRKSRIEVGQGLEGDMTDILTGRLLRDIKPLLRQQQYFESVIYLLEQLTAKLPQPLLFQGDQFPRPDPDSLQKQRSSSPSLFVGLLKLFFLFLFVAFMFISPRFQGHRQGWGYSSGGYGGRSSRGGGWSGGGGGFSGGGSSSDW